MRVAPRTDCGLRTADCGSEECGSLLQSAVRGPQSAIDWAVPSDVPNLVLPVGVVSFEHWLDLNA